MQKGHSFEGNKVQILDTEKQLASDLIEIKLEQPFLNRIEGLQHHL